MKKVNTFFLLTMVGVLGFLFSYVSDANAIPAFARKYDVSCTMCHTAFPKLNDFGVNFRDNGYQMGADSDLPTSLDKGYFPIAFRTTVGYQYASQDHAQGLGTNQSLSNHSSGLGSTNMDFLSAGTLDRDISFLVVPTGEQATFGGAATFHLESAWVRFDNLMNSPMLNLKVGYGDIDLPFSEHRSLTPITTYAIYHYIPGIAYNNSNFPLVGQTSSALSNGDIFQFGNHQGVIQLMGHRTDPLGNFRYAVNLISNTQSTNAAPNGGSGGHDLGYYLHVTQAMYGGGYSSGYRGGLFYLNMPVPTVFDANGSAIPVGPATGIANAGSSPRTMTKYGLDLSGNFLENKLNVFGVYMIGQEPMEVIPGANDTAKFWGGFIEANYMPIPKLMLVGRYDLIRNSNQPCPTYNTSNAGAPVSCSAAATPVPATPPATGGLLGTDKYNDVDGFTFAARYALVVHNRGEIWFHSEFNETTNKKTAFDGSDLKNDTLFLGLDFAY